uniref:Cholecystokinin n=3 Tax=Equus TaxID=9789 RepID=A0A5F5PVM8_HORSE
MRDALPERKGKQKTFLLLNRAEDRVYVRPPGHRVWFPQKTNGAPPDARAVATRLPSVLGKLCCLPQPGGSGAPRVPTEPPSPYPGCPDPPREPADAPPFRSQALPLLSAAMNSGACLCVLMAVLAAGALAQPVPPEDAAGPGAQQEEAPRRQLRAVQRVDSEPRAHLGALLARYIQQTRKAPSGRMSLVKNLQGLDPSHRISDRDYMGWMDFGRRSAEEYEYPS